MQLRRGTMPQKTYLCTIILHRIHEQNRISARRRAAAGFLRRLRGPHRTRRGRDAHGCGGRTRPLHLPREGGPSPFDLGLHAGVVLRRRTAVGRHGAVRAVGRAADRPGDGTHGGALPAPPLGVRRRHRARRRRTVPAHLAVEHGPRLRPGETHRATRPPLRRRGMGADDRRRETLHDRRHGESLHNRPGDVPPRKAHDRHAPGRTRGAAQRAGVD